MIRLSNPGWKWRDLQVPNLTYAQSAAIEDCIERILAGWEGTTYMSGQQLKGEKADCIGFVFGVVDELYGRPSPTRDVLPPDTSMHSREKAIATMRTLRRLYAPNTPVADGSLEPGDIIVTGHAQGGPGHVMIVGPRRNTLWHCNEGIGARQTGIGFISGHQIIYGVYRFDDREKWLR